MRDFSDQVGDADIALVFYAGHGMELNGVNYLIPVDATLARDVDVEDEAIAVDRVIRTIEPAHKLQLVILDACRDNPFVRSMRRTFVSRSVRSGHADIDERALPPNTLIAYARKSGLTAEDGSGADSPYTTALLKHLTTPGLDVELALRRVRDEVLKATSNRQEPFKYGSLGGSELPLVPAAASRPSPTAPETGWSEAEREWQQYGKDTKDIRLLEAFKEKHKADPVYVRLADARIGDLKREESKKIEAEHQAVLRRRLEEEQKKQTETTARAKTEAEARNQTEAQQKPASLVQQKMEGKQRAEKQVATISPTAPKSTIVVPPVAEQAYEALMSSVLNKQVKTGSAFNVGHVNPYRQKPHPKALAVCVRWERSTVNNW